jgi:hypothetical protein
VETAPEPTWAFPGIKDADVHIIVVESYGATLLEREEYRTQMLPLYGSLESDLSEKGYAVFSGIVDSPAFGGRSWLADATILTGTTISDQGSYDGFVAQGIGARLLELMGNAGYRRIYAAPGTRTAPEDWRRAYPFDAYVLRYDFGYEGPFISFGAMPDQFMLNYVADHGLAQGVKDFALYLLVSSHVPFEQIPKYAEDWRFPLNGAEIGEGDILRFDNNWLSGKELAQGYLAGIGYSLRSSVGYIADRLVSKDSGNPGDQNIALIIGDHQPRKPVSHGTADFGVPFHLIVPEALATDRLAEELAAWKAARGMVPAQAAGRRTMASMVQMLEAIFMGEP